MAILKTKNRKVEIKDGDSISNASEELGVLMACKDGTCKECIIKVVEGMENLSELTEWMETPP